MPSEKFKISKASRSIRHAAQNFFGTFSVSPNGPQSTSTSYPIVGGNISSIHEDPESHLDRRSAHNALERQRRETLNSKFQELAHALPALQSVRRPSKTMIVAKSLDYVAKSIQRENHYVNQIKELRKQNERLRKQAKISKLATVHKPQPTINNKRKIAALSTTSSTSTTSTEAPPPMTPPLSSSLSSNASSCTMQRSCTGQSNTYHHQQMSPPLTPETPNKKQQTLSPLMDAATTTITTTTTAAPPNWAADPSMMLMTTMPTSTSTVPSNATMMMMPPQQQQQQQQQQQWPTTNNDPMFSSTSTLDLYSTNNMYTTSHHHHHHHHSPPPSMLQDASHYMSLSDPNIHSMLFAPYQWQDNPPVYHPPVPATKASDPLYLA